VQRLSRGKVPSQTELDTARATLARAIADAAAARASVADAKAALSSDETNLAKASIRSPIDGVVLTRAVEPGQAVAASLQAVTLLTIAEDLTKMKLQVNVDEADVGAVKAGQGATFTVSAYPRRKYPATITRVAYGSSTTDNVVTYVTYLDVDNADLSLRPGMTATATIAASARENVLLVPNTALRFTPTGAGAPAPADVPAAKSSGGGLVSKLLPRMPGRQRRSAGEATGANASVERRVWVLRDGVPAPVAITVGISDGRVTEVTGGDLQAGMPVIVDQSGGNG
jgi:HlyD family secretion protein